MKNNPMASAVPQEKTAPHRSGYFGLLINLIGMISSKPQD